MSDEQIISALRQETLLLEAADEALATARTEFELAARRYAAIRDAAAQHRIWPYDDDARRLWPDETPIGHEYRFIRMPIGRAVRRVLLEATKPLSVNQILSTLMLGGINRDTVSGNLRSVTAVLTKSDDIEEISEGQFRLKSVDQDDLPFE